MASDEDIMGNNYMFVMLWNVSVISHSGLLSFIISKSDKHEFSSIWNLISCSNDVMNHADCVVKLDVYPQKMHSCSGNIRGIPVFVLKISVVYKKNIYIMGDIALIFA